MSKRYFAVAFTLTLCTVVGAAAAAFASSHGASTESGPGSSAEIGQQPRIINARMSSQPAGSLLQTFRSIVNAQTEAAWIGYSVPIAKNDHEMCSWPPQATAPVKLEGSEWLMVLFRVADRQVERIKAFSEVCELDAGGRPVTWLQDVRPAESIALLESLLGSGDDRRNRVTSAALSAIGMHADPSAAPTLIRLARSHASARIRGDAIFWVAQLAGTRAVGAISESIDRDPDTDVKKRAVFALSQLPKDEGVPLLIDVARKNANPAVRKQAIFWLGQSKDPRALEFFADLLK